MKLIVAALFGYLFGEFFYYMEMWSGDRRWNRWDALARIVAFCFILAVISGVVWSVRHS